MTTINDVAQHVGVSACTVSKVLNDKPVRVSNETRQRILDAAKSLNYMANRAAQQLKTGRFNTIALCLERHTAGFFLNVNANQMIAGIGSSAIRNELSLLFHLPKPSEVFSQTIGSLPSQGVDGGIVLGPLNMSDTNIAAIDNSRIPLVCIDSHPRLASASTVDADNYTGMKMGVQHLISKGHKKMAYVGPALQFQCLLDRMAGFYEAVREAGLPVDEQVIQIVSLENAPAAVRQSVEAIDGPTALICAEGEIGATVLDEVKRLGLRLPDDLSILVYDDVSADSLAGSINILHNDFYNMGEAAGDLLNKLIDGKCSGPVSLRLPPKFEMCSL